MINGKYVIGICVSQTNNEELIDYINKLYQYAKARDYLTIVYNLTSDVYRFDGDMKEIGIPSIVNYKYVDAVVVLNDPMINDEVVDICVSEAKKHGKPRVVIGRRHADAFSIDYQGDDCFEMIVRHIVEEHGCKKVNFIAGRKDLEFSAYWVDVYRVVLEENGIEFDEDRVAWGEYWAGPVYKIIDKWVEEHNLPEAIICANDAMAIAACKRLSEHGYSAPENILVTGFDGIIREKYHTPRLTTGRVDVKTICEIAMEVISDAVEGGSFNPMYLSQQYNLSIAQSCGCEKRDYALLGSVSNEIYDELMENHANESYTYRMAGRLASCTTKEEICKVAARYMNGDMYMALRDNLWSTSTERVPLDYNEAVTTTSNDRYQENQRKIFPLGEFLPDLRTVDQATDFIQVYMLRCNDEVFGYLVDHSATLTKSNAFRYSRYVNMMNVVLNIIIKQQGLMEMNKKLADMQTRDSLTGLYNSRGFIREVHNRYIENPKGETLVLCSIDIKRLKSINETFGHDEGDRALIALAEMIKASASVGDICSAYGSDEFVVATSTSEDADYIIYKFISALTQSLVNHNTLYDKQYTLEVTTESIVGKPKNDDEVQELMRMLLEKKASRKAVHGGKKLELTEEEMKEEKEFTTLVDNNLFKYMYQPIVEAKTGEIYGYEALMRSTGDIQLNPLKIIEIATRRGELEKIESATFRNVLADVDANADKFGDRRIFVNSIISDHLALEEATELVTRYENLKDRMIVEITEQSDVDDEEYIKYTNFMTAHGIKIAIDDYGTGYSNTARIIGVTPSVVKIDRSLISGIHADYKKQHFVANMIQYAHENNFLALAEGVENANELKAIIRMDIDLIQGYYTARPSFEVISEIDEKIKKDMKRYAVKRENLEAKKTFISGDENSIDIFELSLDSYSEVFITESEVEIKGAKEVAVPITIKLKDDQNYTITMRDVSLKQTLGHTGLIIGKNSHVNLIFEGRNEFERGGIYVPQSSSLSIIGDGTLRIHDAHTFAYGIGAGEGETCGNIDIFMPEGITIELESDKGIGIGCDVGSLDTNITITRTPINLVISTVNGAAIGCLNGDINVNMVHMSGTIDLRSRYSVGLGSLFGEVNLLVDSSHIGFVANGNIACLMGGQKTNNKSIVVKNSNLKAESHCREFIGIGAEDGDLTVEMFESNFEVNAEGAEVLLAGTKAKTAKIRMEQCQGRGKLATGEFILYGAEPENLINIDGNNKFEV